MEALGAIGGSIIGGLFGNSAASKAADAQKYAANLQQQRYNQTRADLQPYMGAGTNSLNKYNDATGANGQGAQAAYYANFQNDPGFQSGVNYGLDTISAQLGKQNHGQLSGNEEKAWGDYAQTQLYNQYHTRLDDLFRAGQLGENAAAQTGSIGNSSGQAQGNFAATAGQYNALGTAAIGNAFGTAAKNLASYYYKPTASTVNGQPTDASAYGGINYSAPDFSSIAAAPAF